ncbi:hypothetical protein [Tumebacillus flagellatus]|uniref:DUF2197 domain-containing protein n=1 Tax=Tumebacillus flagellatus TaxID=1157490 RepID=A0A074LS86_9BACL|nr:hypothetical protein [Tumebacillus flagellatus]KEO82638.1 hypothetical protein EL26_13800 [Tumebacillus flagellatus]
MISYDVRCFFCRSMFSVLEGTPQYKLVKRNMDGRHCCDDCRKLIEQDAQRESGMTPELFAALEQLELEERLSKYDDMKDILKIHKESKDPGHSSDHPSASAPTNVQ